MMLTETDLDHLIFPPRGLMRHSPPNQRQPKVSPFDHLHYSPLWSLQEMKVNNPTSFAHFHFPSLCSTPISGTGFQCLCIY